MSLPLPYRPLLWLVLLLVSIAPAAAATSSLAHDEYVELLPGLAWLTPDGQWQVELEARVYEFEEDSVWRAALLDELLDELDAEDYLTPDQIRMLETRLRQFLVDNERGKQVWVQLADQVYALPLTGADGRTTGHFLIPSTTAGLPADNLAAPVWLPARVVHDLGNSRHFESQVQLIPPTGLSVVSDIDDTIKHSEVLDRRELLANTFIRSPKPVEGMDSLYREWASQGAAFHYVSNSPIQLAEPLLEFLALESFPAGSIHLRSFRLWDGSLIDFLFSTDPSHKRSTIERLLALYPDRRFVFIGDSGERDPEIYGEIARRHHTRIAAIRIRAISGSNLDPARWQTAFAHLPTDLWRVDPNPSNLGLTAPPAPAP